VAPAECRLARPVWSTPPFEGAQTSLKISLQVQLPVTVSESVEIAIAAEDAGFDAVWFASPGRSADVFMALSAVAQATSRIELGTAIATIWVRHPSVTYQQAISLQEIAAGRFTLGLGVSHAAFLTSLGLEYDRPMQAITEYATIVRSLVEHGRVDYTGEFFSTTIESSQPRWPLPIYLAVVGSGMAAVAGRLSDGVLPVATPPAYVEDVIVPALTNSARAANRPTPSIGVLVPTSLLTDPAAVLEGVRSQIGSFPRVPAYEKIFRSIDPGDGPTEWNRTTLDAIVTYGERAQVQERISAYSAVGVSELVVMPMDRSGFATPGMLERCRALYE
jgi:alkanesulfonate monooxygenase SsuD/methylene tetrahydromethanopterin reductase-like flavin-dependent oxidoreductase (luciferase family)